MKQIGRNGGREGGREEGRRGRGASKTRNCLPACLLAAPTSNAQSTLSFLPPSLSPLLPSQSRAEAAVSPSTVLFSASWLLHLAHPPPLPPTFSSFFPQGGAPTSSVIYSTTPNGTACVHVTYWPCRRPTPRRSSPASAWTGLAVRPTYPTPTTTPRTCIGARMDGR